MASAKRLRYFDLDILIGETMEQMFGILSGVVFEQIGAIDH